MDANKLMRHLESTIAIIKHQVASGEFNGVRERLILEGKYTAIRDLMLEIDKGKFDNGPGLACTVGDPATA